MATQRFYDGQPGPDIRRELNNFEAILDGTVAAAQDASTAATSASVKAQQWADAAPGVEVETGKYSAKHWAARAQTTVTGGLIYRGSHSAASGAYPATPSLGDYYKISIAGTLGGVDYSVGDSIIYNGTNWDKIDSTDAVTSVAGRVGAVVLTKGDVGLNNVDNTSDANKPVSTATQTALNGKADTAHTHTVANVTGLQAALNGKEPTIAAGTATQYWRGDKTWRNFFTDVRAATLTGLSTATNAVVDATDTVLAAIGKLQAQVSAKFDKTGGDVGGNINFTGTGRRITGDFSNGTVASRVMFQTSTSNGNTVVSTLPTGTSTTSGFRAYGSDNLLNGISVDLIASIASGDVRLISNAYGTGTYLPLAFHTGGSERMRIDTSGSVGIGEAPSSQYKFQAANGNWCLHSDVGQLFIESSGRVNRWWIAANISDTVNDGVYIGRGGNGVGTGTKVLKILNDTTHINPNGGLGYGVGAGGTVVQATSKSTPVTLNKPTGQITMNDAALAAGASASFQANNTLVLSTDTVVVTVFNNANYRVEVMYVVGGGNFGVRVTNVTGDSLAEALKINFTIIKGATS